MIYLIQKSTNDQFYSFFSLGAVSVGLWDLVLWWFIWYDIWNSLFFLDVKIINIYNIHYFPTQWNRLFLKGASVWRTYKLWGILHGFIIIVVGNHNGGPAPNSIDGGEAWQETDQGEQDGQRRRMGRYL